MPGHGNAFGHECKYGKLCGVGRLKIADWFVAVFIGTQSAVKSLLRRSLEPQYYGQTPQAG
jgi:hypothetical protein